MAGEAQQEAISPSPSGESSATSSAVSVKHSDDIGGTFGTSTPSIPPSGGAAGDHRKHGEAPACVVVQRGRRPLWARVRKFCLRHRYRLVGLAVLLVIVIVVASCHSKVAVAWEAYSSWLETNKSAGAISFVLVTALLTVVCFPAAIPTLAAGAIYGACTGIGPGVALGTAIIFVGATLGSILAFLFGRYIFTDWLQAINSRSRWLTALDKALRDNGLKVIVLMRLSPVVPYSVFNYLASLTSVHFKDFLLGSVAILPGTVLFVFLGAQSAAALIMVSDDMKGGDEGEAGGSDTSHVIEIVALVAGAAISILALLLISYYTKKELRRYIPGMDHFDESPSMASSHTMCDPLGGDGCVEGQQQGTPQPVAEQTTRDPLSGEEAAGGRPAPVMAWAASS